MTSLRETDVASDDHAQRRMNSGQEKIRGGEMRKLLYTAVSLALCASANADPLTATQSVLTGSITRSISDTSMNGEAATSPVSKNLSFGMFNSGTGVLVGVSSGLSFNSGTLTLSASGTLTSGSGPVSFASEGTIFGSSNLPGMSAFGSIHAPLTNACADVSGCFPGGAINLSDNGNLSKTGNTWLSPTASAQVANLDQYVGTASLASTLTVTPSISLTDEQRISAQTARIAVDGLKGAQSLTYSYLRHADASFASGANADNLSPLTLTRGNARDFAIFNLGDASTAKLDFVGLQCVSGHCGAFDISLPSFQDLAAGSSVAGSAALIAGVTGNYDARYLLTFSDDSAIGATASHLTNALTLDVQGSVAPVPEPGTWAMLGLGLAGLAYRYRKRLHYRNSEVHPLP
jgi:hypothetical protein